MSKRSGSIVIVAGIAIIVIIYFLVYGFNSAVGDPWKLIPEDAAVVLQIDHPRQFIDKFSDDNELFKSFRKSEDLLNLQNNLSEFDSILKSDHLLYRFLHIPLLISVHCDTTFNESCLLFVSQPNSPQETENLRNQLSEHFTVAISENNSTLLSITEPKSKTTFYAGFEEGLIVLSKNEWLAEKALNTNRSMNHFSNAPSFKTLQNTAGRYVDARLFINYQNFSKLLSNHLTNGHKKAIEWLGTFADWTETDLLIKSDELILTGFTTTKSGNHLNNYSHNSTERNKLFGFLPANTNILLAASFSDAYSVINNDKLKSLNEDLNFDLSMFLEICGDEMALASNALKANSTANDSWFFMQLKNPSRADGYLKRISANTGGRSSDEFNGHVVREIRRKNMIPDLFGNAFSIIENTWYVLIGDFVVFGNSPQSLHKLLRHYDSGKTLDLNENFKQFADNISESYSVLLYLKPSDLEGIVPNYLDAVTSQNVKESKEMIADFPGLAFQFIEGDSMFYTNFYLKNNKSAHEESLASWKLQLNDALTGRPHLVKDHKTNTYNLIVFDIQSNMYLISTDGQVLWKKRIDALPESKIHEVDFYKNRKIQYLFNTKDFVYLIDKKGNQVANYPLKLSPSATNGLTLFDYSNKKDYRIMLAQADKRIYNYTIQGRQVKGWSRPKTSDFVSQEISRLVINNKDYIIITDTEDNVYIVNRKGNTRIKLDQNPDKARNSSYYANNTNSKGIIITTDLLGRLVYISSKGKLQFTDFGEFSPNHFFLYEDFDGNGAEDFIYIDGNRLQVFDRYKKVLFSYDFPSEIAIKPEFFKLTKKETVLGVVADQEKTIYLFDNKGNTLVNKGLVGETPFTVGSLKNNSEINLITAAGDVLYNYRIK